MSIGSLTIDLLARTGSFTTDLDRASKHAKKRAKEIDEAFTKAGKAIGVALAAGATAAGYAFKSTIDRMDELSKAAQRASMPTEDFSRLAYAADLADVSMQDLQGSMGKLAKAQGDAARGLSEQVRAFDALGIAYKNTDGSLRDTNAVFLEFADRFQEFQGSPEVVALGMQLFGRSFQTLMPLLKDGASGLREAGAEADALGVTLSTKAGQQAEAFNDNITRLTKSVEGLKIELFSGLIPQLDSVIGRFLAATREGLGFVDAIDIGMGVEGFRRLDDQILVTRNTIKQMQDMIDSGVGPGGGFVNVEGLQREIAEYNAQLDRLIRVQRRIAGRNPDTGSLGALVSEPPTEKPRTLRLLGGSGKSGEDKLASVIDAAVQRDFERLEALREQADEFEALISKALADDEATLRRQADAWKDLIDPTRAYARQLEEIRALVQSGDLSPAEGIAAEFEVESRRNDELLRGIGDQTQKASDAARELGLTFSSAFEDAIIGGKKFSDVLAGIGADLLRLTIRKSITEPAADWLSSALNIGSLFGGARADGGPVTAGSAYLVGERGPELFTPGTSGSVVPNHALGGSVNVTNHYTFGAGVNAAQLTHYAEQIRRQTVADVFDKMRRANHSGDYAVMGG
jgi:hypothetical protein